MKSKVEVCIPRWVSYDLFLNQFFENFTHILTMFIFTSQLFLVNPLSYTNLWPFFPIKAKFYSPIILGYVALHWNMINISGAKLRKKLAIPLSKARNWQLLLNWWKVCVKLSSLLWDLVWFRLLQVLGIMLQPLWAHTCIFPVVSSRQCFLVLFPCFPHS